MDREQRVELAVRVAGILIIAVYGFGLLRAALPLARFSAEHLARVVPLLLGVVLLWRSGPVARWAVRKESGPPHVRDNLRLGLILMAVWYIIALSDNALQALLLPMQSAAFAPRRILAVLPHLLPGLALFAAVGVLAAPLADRLSPVRADHVGPPSRILGVALPLMAVQFSIFGIRQLGIAAVMRPPPVPGRRAITLAVVISGALWLLTSLALALSAGRLLDFYGRQRETPEEEATGRLPELPPARVVQVALCLTAVYLLLGEVRDALAWRPAEVGGRAVGAGDLLVVLLGAGLVSVIVLFVTGRAGLWLGRVFYGRPDASEDEVKTARLLLAVGVSIVALRHAIPYAAPMEWPAFSMEFILWWGLGPAVALGFLVFRGGAAHICIWGAPGRREAPAVFAAHLWPWLLVLGLWLLLSHLPLPVYGAASLVMPLSEHLDSAVWVKQPNWVLMLSMALALVIFPRRIARLLSRGGGDDAEPAAD